jgi:hypothetical protein
VAFGAVQDELEYAYAVRQDKEKKRAARAKTKGIKALSVFIAQALLRKKVSGVGLFAALTHAFSLKC